MIIKLYGEKPKETEKFINVVRILKVPQGDMSCTVLEAEIEGAEKESAEGERAEKIREKVLDFIAEIKKARIPITFIADELTRYIALFRVFGITNGRGKYILEILSSELDEEIKKIEAEGQA